MVFTLESHFDKEEKDILIKAHNIIQDMMNEMEHSGLELYQGSSIDDWRDIKNKIKDLVT
jgi:sporulation-control protein spo0M